VADALAVGRRVDDMAHDSASDASYAEAVKYIFANADFSGAAKRYQNPHENWQRFEQLLEAIGQPARRLKIVHIAGTNGKGTTSALCDTMLRASEAGSVGLFTSPHLHSFRERIRLDGRLVSKAAVVAALGVVRPAVESLGYASPFEKLTALALVCFVEAGCAWAVLETGLGGRWDCTNHSAPLVCGITRIGYDHMNVLGSTIGAIAGEKAGILKKATPAFCVPQEAEAMGVLTRVAEEVGAPLRLIESGEEAASSLPRWLSPRHQQHNAAMATAMLSALAEGGHVRAGLASAWREAVRTVSWPCRFEVLRPSSLPSHVSLLLDVAHNEPAVAALLTSVAAAWPTAPIALVFGANGDKDVGKIVPMLRAMPGLVLGVAVQSSHPKALPAARLLESDGKKGGDGDSDGAAPPADAPWVCAASMLEALEKAGAALHGAGATGGEGLVVCCGSVFVAADMRYAVATQQRDLFAEEDWVWEQGSEAMLM
jgi:dihydrofolate synthase/folylpolyglutamate synthase